MKGRKAYSSLLSGGKAESGIVRTAHHAEGGTSQDVVRRFADREVQNQYKIAAGIALRIQHGEPAAMEDLYKLLETGVRYFMLRCLGPVDIDDKIHDCFVAITQAIRNGELRDPERLMGFVHTIVRRRISTGIEEAVKRRSAHFELEGSILGLADRRENPEARLVACQRAGIARRAIEGLSNRDREILRRFYVMEQTKEQICLEMSLTDNQFRLMKSRAKERFGKLGRELVLAAPISPFVLDRCQRLRS